MFYDLYIRLMVWLGAAPPPGYERFLPELERHKLQPPSDQREKSEAIPTSNRGDNLLAFNDNDWITEDELPEWLKESRYPQQVPSFTSSINTSTVDTRKSAYKGSQKGKIRRTEVHFILVMILGIGIMAFSVYRWITEQNIQNQLQQEGISTQATIIDIWKEFSGKVYMYHVKYQFNAIYPDGRSELHTQTERISAGTFNSLADASTTTVRYLNSKPVIARIELVPVHFYFAFVWWFSLGAFLTLTVGIPLLYSLKVKLKLKKLAKMSQL